MGDLSDFERELIVLAIVEFDGCICHTLQFQNYSNMIKEHIGQCSIF